MKPQPVRFAICYLDGVLCFYDGLCWKLEDVTQLI